MEPFAMFPLDEYFHGRSDKEVCSTKVVQMPSRRLPLVPPLKQAA
jgi:hypothetical protein